MYEIKWKFREIKLKFPELLGRAGNVEILGMAGNGGDVLEELGVQNSQEWL